MRTKILGAILFVMPAAVLSTTQASAGEKAAAECNTKPGLSAPAGRHWYYRINHASKRQCWYLGAEGLRVHERAARSPAAPQPKTDAAEPAAVTAETAPAAIAPPAPVAAAPPPEGGAEAMAFAERWPSLPAAQNFDGLAAMRSSYADADAANDATPQMPAQWPVVETSPARADLPTEPGLQSLPLAGPLGLALLVLVGASLDLAIAPRRSPFRRIWRAIVTPRQPRPRLRRMPVRTAAQGGGEGGRRPLTLTDPAVDLKRSLRELMRDLQRAGIGCDPPQSFAPAAAGNRDPAYRPTRSRPLSTRLEALHRYSPPGRARYAHRRV